MPGTTTTTTTAADGTTTTTTVTTTEGAIMMSPHRAASPALRLPRVVSVPPRSFARRRSCLRPRKPRAWCSSGGGRAAERTGVHAHHADVLMNNTVVAVVVTVTVVVTVAVTVTNGGSDMFESLSTVPVL